MICFVQVFIDPETLDTISPFEYCANLASDAGDRQESHTLPRKRNQTPDGALNAGGFTPTGQDRGGWGCWLGGRDHVRSDECNLRKRSVQATYAAIVMHISQVKSETGWFQEEASTQT